MGRLQPLGASMVVLYATVVLAGYSTNKKDLERAAELAVERAAEKAAERAVEKALNSGNSSTVTVTVKESYANAKKTAEEAAAPGSESTRPYDPAIYDRQYAYKPPSEYEVDERSAEAEELGVSKESLNSSVEDLGASEAPETTTSGGGGAGGGGGGNGSSSEASVASAELVSFESTKETADKPSKAFDVSASIGFGADFSGLDLSGDFGLKSKTERNTKTFSSSYTKPSEFPELKLDVDEDDAAEIFKMYAGEFGQPTEWSKAKEKGWVRHRPLWDDAKRVPRNFFESFGDVSAVESRVKDEKAGDKPQKSKMQKRMAEPIVARGNQMAVPLATLSLDPKMPSTLLKILQREIRSLPSKSVGAKSPLPMTVYITLPMPYVPAHGFQRNIEPRDLEPISPRQINDETTNGDFEVITKEPNKRSYTLASTDFPLQTSKKPGVETRAEATTPKLLPIFRKSYSSVVKAPLKKYSAKSTGHLTTTLQPIQQVQPVRKST